MIDPIQEKATAACRTYHRVFQRLLDTLPDDACGVACKWPSDCPFLAEAKRRLLANDDAPRAV